MNAFLRTALVLFVLSFPLVASAQSYVPIEQRLSVEQLRTVGLTPAQLEQLNRMLRQAQEKDVAAAPAPAPAPVAPPRQSSPADDAGRDRSSLIGFNDEPIRSRLTGPVSGWEPGTVFALENGQQWKVLKGHMRTEEAAGRAGNRSDPRRGRTLVPAGARGLPEGARLPHRLTPSVCGWAVAAANSR